MLLQQDLLLSFDLQSFSVFRANFCAGQQSVNGRTWHALGAIFLGRHRERKHLDLMKLLQKLLYQGCLHFWKKFWIILAEEEGNVQAVGERGRESTTRQSWHLERRCSFFQ